MNMGKKSLYLLIDAQRKAKGEMIAIQFAGGKISYSELMSMVDSIRYQIKQKKVVNQAIIVATNREPKLIAAMIAIVESGNYYVPIDYIYPKDRIDYIVAHSKAQIVIVDEMHKGLFERYDTIVLSEEHNNNFVKVEVDEERIHGTAYCLYTSGTTGNPKGVLIPEDALINFIYGMDQTIPFKECSSILCATTQCFDIFFLESITALALGVMVYLTEIEEGTNPKRLARLIEENKIDMIQMTPSRVSMIKEYDPTLASFKDLKIIMIGGEAFPKALLTELQKNTSARIFNMYGPTETTIWSSVAELTESTDIHIGLPILNTTFYVMDKNGNCAKEGESGELCIGGAGLSNGYLFDAEKTAQRFIVYNGERIYKTGDSATYIREKNEYKVFGRLDNQIKLNGFRIELEEIESICSNIEGINQVVIYPYREEGAVKKLIMFYTATGEIDRNKIAGNLSKYLPAYMIPAKYMQVEKFEYTDNGKIDRKKIIYSPETQSKVVYVGGQDGWNLFRQMFYEVSGYAISEKGDELLKDIIDSLHFVKFIVAIESEYDFEMEDEYLDMNKYKDVLDFFLTVCQFIS